MSGLFNIFRESENNPTLALNKAKENNTHSFGAIKLKSIGTHASYTSTKSHIPIQNKPKGLSIRSKSDLNVSSVNNFGINKQATKECTKPKEKQCLTNKQLSPFKLKTPKSKSLSISSPKKSSPKISSPIMQNVVDDFVFTKPTTPKQTKKSSYPQAEKLAYDFDFDKYLVEEMQLLMNNDLTSIRTARKSESEDSISSLEDEGFISDYYQDSFDSENGYSVSMASVPDVDLPDFSDSDCD